MNCLTPFQITELNGKKFLFKEVVHGVDGCEVLKFDNSALLKIIKKACQRTVQEVNTRTNFSGRPNEFGNLVANYFGFECTKLGLDYTKPTDKNGKAKESGYPDGLIQQKGSYCYIEVKTCEHSKLQQTFRTFFYSPSASSKIIHNAPHLLIGFETDKDGDILILNGEFHITDMFNKEVTLKLEYNTNNKCLYKFSELL